MNLTKRLNLDLQSYVIPKEIMNPAYINAVGIDLGTSRCFAAVSRRNGIETVALDNSGERQLPSYVSFDEKNEKCGQIVINRLEYYANSTVFDSKRIIGRNFKEVEINSTWPFQIIKKKNKPKIRIQGPDGVLEKHPEEVVNVLLKHIKQKVEEFQGKKLDQVVITVPASFNRYQKSATCLATVIADWKTVYLLSEPIAAAIAYFIDRPIPNNLKFILIDLGGGTLDISIFKIVQGNLKIKASNGEGNLGGRDFDLILFNYFANILRKEYKTNIEEKNLLKYRLMQKSMEIKHSLSTEFEVSLDVNDFNHKCEGFLTITRHDFEIMAEPLLNRINEVIIQTLSGLKYTARDINKVLLVGGGCRMPMVRELLRKVFKKSEHSCNQHPDEMVAIGAAYYASYINYKSRFMTEVEQNHIIPPIYYGRH